MNAALSPAAYEGGLTEPVFAAQAIFRKIMDAFSEPGRIVDVAGMACAPSPLSEASAAYLAALADYDTPVWFEDRHVDDATAWLAFHTGAPVTQDPALAAIAVLYSQSAIGGWARLAIGTSSYPDRSATLLLPVGSLSDGPSLTLAGPGIETTRSISPSGLPGGFVSAMAENRSRFPLGFDILLVCGGEAIALPRSTRITEA